MHATSPTPLVLATDLLIAAFAMTNTLAPTALCQAAEKHDLRIGAAVRPDLFGKPGDTEALSSHLNLVTPENAMKMPARCSSSRIIGQRRRSAPCWPS